MAIAKEITKFHYKELKGFSGLLFGAVVFLPLFFASIFYYLGICFKNFLYKIGVLKEISVKAKVICIGNLKPLSRLNFAKLFQKNAGFHP